MPLIDTKCKKCGSVDEQMRPLSMYPETPPCPHCGEQTEQIHLPASQRRWSADPVVVFKAPDGSVRFPGDAAGVSAANYRQQGFEEVQIRGAAEMRRFERAMDKQEYSRAQRRVEHACQQREANDAARASEIRRGMEQGFRLPEMDPRTGQPTGRMTTVRLSDRGRAIMRAAQESGARRPKPSFSGAGFHSEVYSYDRSNREESRDSSGRRRRD